MDAAARLLGLLFFVVRLLCVEPSIKASLFASIVGVGGVDVCTGGVEQKLIRDRDRIDSNPFG